MKLHSIISAIVLGTAAHVQAQETPLTPPRAPAGGGLPQARPEIKRGTNGVPAESTISQPPAATPGAIFNLNLNASKLGDSIGQIENGIGDTQRNGNEQRLMPNIIFTGDSRDAAMPGNMRLTGVSPVQAVALVCAAAGCAIEPIYAPAEEAVLPGASGPANPGKVIGYRIVRESAKMSGISFAEIKPTQQIQSTVTAAKAKLQTLRETLSANHPSVEAAEMELVRLLRMLEQAGSVTLPHVKAITGSDSFARADGGLTAISGADPSAGSGGDTDSTDATVKPPDADQKITRVYALRGILGEGKDYGRKQEACEVLINEALRAAGVDKTKESPGLSFHQDSRVLLVKATAAQQDIVLQIIEALKENENQPVQKAGDLKENPSEPTPEVIKPNK